MKKFINTIRCVVAVAAVSVFSTAQARETALINDAWTFSFDGDTAVTAVALPHSWNGDAYFTRDYRRGKGVYTRQIKAPVDMAGRRLFLKLDGAASKSSVTIDGREAGSHVGAYTSHTIDITPFITDGATHTLAVSVDNSDRDVPPWSADFTFMGGLYRDAWLIESSAVHLDFTRGTEEGFRVSARPTADGGEVEVSGAVVNDSDSRRKVNVVSTLSDASGKVIARKSCRLDIGPMSSKPFSIEMNHIAGIDLWSPDSPTLYTVETEVVADGVTLDSGRCHTAFRTFGFDYDGRFMLNGIPLKLRGMCRHQDQRPVGIALSDDCHRRDMEMIKEMGANFVRISHYPQDDAVLEMCDRLGLIVWEEVPVIDYVPDSEAFADNCEIMLREMIARHYNHPSVAMWGYMNEILLRVPQDQRDSTYLRTAALARRLQAALLDEDTTRLSTMAFHGSDVYHVADLGEITDVKGWNLYQGWYGGQLDEFGRFLSRQHNSHPSHRLIVSEYGAGSDLRLHSLDPEPFDFSMEYQQRYLEHYLPVIEDSAFVAGASHWNFIDFSSANRAESMPHINNKGLVTNDRRKKDVYYYYKAAWTDRTDGIVGHIAVRDWADRMELADTSGVVERPVKVYTNEPVVSLRINGVSLAAQHVDNFNAVFDVPLREGLNVIELAGADGVTIIDAATVNLKTITIDNGIIDPKTMALAVNVGSGCYFRADDSGLTWLPDRQYSPGSGYGHVGGERAVSQDEIALTSDQPLMQRSVCGLDEYRFDVVDGLYEIEISAVDQASPSALSAYMLGHNAGSGASDMVSMDIIVNGREVERSFSPAVTAGQKTAVTRRYTAVAADGSGLSVRFTPAGGITSLSAIKIRKL